MADFNLGRIKFKWRGDWSTSTSYLIDDIIKYGGNTYVCTVNHTSLSTSPGFYTDLSASKWSLHTEGLFFKGNWAGSTHYKLNDLIKVGGYQYRTTTQHTSGGTFDGTKFEIYSEGLQWEDSYNAGTTYQEGDVVSYGGYTYIYINSTPSSGNTPTDNSYWDLLTTGFKSTGTYSGATAYKTGDTIVWGGNAYVCITNTTAGQSPYSDGAKWQLISEGLKWLGSWSSLTTYKISEAVEYSGSSYVSLQNGNLNVTPGTNGSVWSLLTQGDPNIVLTTRGDITYRNVSGTARLPVGVAGTVLTSNGLEPKWADPSNFNTLYVSNSGSDSNPGTQFLPFRTIKYALSQCSKADILEIGSISGGIGGTAGVYDVSGTGGSGTGFTARITLDGTNPPSTSDIEIINGGKNYTVGNTITISASQIGGSPANNITFDVVTVSIGDLVQVQNGVYREILPLVVPANVTISGESLRGTEVRPASGSSSTIATVTKTGGTGGTPGTFLYVKQTSTNGSGTGMVISVVSDGSSSPTVTIVHGGYNYAVGNTVTFSGANIGGSTNLILTVASLENNNASYMWLMNNTTNIEKLSFKGMTGIATHTGQGAVICSLDPSGSITNQSPYIQNCTSVNDNAIGIKIDGLLHSAGNKSILANDFTQINSDGIGVWALNGGRGEMVSVFTYYTAKSYYATGGGFIRALNCCSAYGEQGAVADGTLASEPAIQVNSKGKVIKFTQGSVLTSNFVIGQTMLGLTSGATGTIFRLNISGNRLHYIANSGIFQKNETVRVTKSDSSTFTFTTPNEDESVPNGQTGYLIEVSSSDGTLSSSGVIKAGDNISFAGVATIYTVTAITNENTGTQTATVRVNPEVTLANVIANNSLTSITREFSNVRLTGHDFLNIGTGDFITTNYPNTPSQSADQDDEVITTNGGRVYFTSTDQSGDFRVGDLFRIQQSTGVATLNADAFDLSGLSELQLGSIGAQIGATINEFSTDETLGGNSVVAVPTEYAVKQYFTKITDEVKPGTDATYDLGSTSYRWKDLNISGKITGPSTLVIDPAAIGDDTGTVQIKGNLQVDGTTTTINSTTLTVDDKNIVLGDGAVNDAAADGSGITVYSGSGNKTWNWVDSTDSWTSSEHIDIATGKGYKINGTTVLSGSTLGSSITASSLTSVGTLTSLTSSGDITDSKGELRSVPQVTKSLTYTLVASDHGKHISTTANIEIPAGVFSTGQTVSIYNNSGSNISLTSAVSVTAYQVGTANTGTRTIAQRGFVTIVCVASNTFVVTGGGLS
jgi:hypothetical protein